MIELKRANPGIKPGDRTEERLQKIRDALIEMHTSLMEQKVTSRMQLPDQTHSLAHSNSSLTTNVCLIGR